MANLTKAEAQLFGMFWGKDNLIDDESFWQIASVLLPPEDGEIVLPLSFNPVTARRILGMLNCLKCGVCCRHYKRVTISDFDIQRIEVNTTFKNISEFVKQDEKGKYLSGAECPFLKDNACQVHDFKPDACYFFPIQGGAQAILEGKSFEAMRIRLNCPAAIAVARGILKESLALSEGKMMLLPDLSIVSNMKQEE